MTPDTRSHAATETVLRELDSIWRQAGVAWTVLGRLPTEKEGKGDVDIAVSAAHVSAAVESLTQLVAQRDWQLLQVLRHEVTCWYAVIALKADDDWHLVCLDICSDYMMDGHRIIDSVELTQNAQIGPDGWPRPEAAISFRYTLLKTIRKNRYSDEIRTVLNRFAVPVSEALKTALGPGDWQAYELWLQEGQEPSHADHTVALHRLRRRPRERLREALRIADRILRPSGLHLVLTGPDGCGKTTAGKGLKNDIAACFRGVEQVHLFRPQTRRINSAAVAPYDQSARGLLGSLLKAGLVIWRSHRLNWKFVAHARLRSKLVLNDRHAVDLLADPKRFRVQLPWSMLKLVLHFCHQPDLTLVFHATAA